MERDERAKEVAALTEQAGRIRGRLEREEPDLLRSGVPMIDYAVDQVRFFRQAWVELKAAGLSDAAALERAEFLSLPECLRQAPEDWKQQLVLQYAFSKQWCGWQRALAARHATDHDRIGVHPRYPDLPGPGVLLSPYPSTVTLPPGPLVTLEANVQMDVGASPSPLHPTRPLAPGLTWFLTLVFFHVSRWRPVVVLIDPPRDLDPVAAQRSLRDLASQVEAAADAAHSAPTPPSEDALKHWRQTAEILRHAADRIIAVSASERAGILQRCFSLPLTAYFAPVLFITEDMPPEVMAMFIGFGLKQAGLLSGPEARIFDRFVEQRCLKDHPELFPAHGRQLAGRMARFRRPLRYRSVTRYERLVLRAIQYPRPRKPGVGPLLRALASRHGLHIRKVYRDFASFLAATGLPRGREAFRRFARRVRHTIRRRGGQRTARGARSPRERDSG
jgi:hypothetical protein